MTARQRAALLALPDDEARVLRHHSLDSVDLAPVATARTPATRLGHALQLCCLRYPGRHLRRGEGLPAAMLAPIAEQVEADVITHFARRKPTRRDQLAAIKLRFGFRGLGRPIRVELTEWLKAEAMSIVDGRALLDRLLAPHRHSRLDALIDEKVYDRQSRLSWLREPEPRVASASLAKILEKLEAIRWTGATRLPVDP